jgi:hypothetical protein
VKGKKRPVCRACSNERVRCWCKRHPGKRCQWREVPISELLSWKVEDQVKGCWLWQGEVSSKGYAIFRRKHVQRMMYEHFCGLIPAGFHIHHICEARNCVSPAHLLACSPQEHLEFHHSFKVTTKDMSPEQRRVARNARARILDRERRRCDPEGVRAKERAAQRRWKEKDPQGYKARRQVQYRRALQRKRSLETGGV